MSDFVLYNYFRSSASYRVRIALNLKGISYDYKAVHLINNGGEQNSPEYRKLNPIRQVPTLVHQGRPIAQSVAILDYLDAIQPEPRLFPKDAFARAQVLQACEIINSGIQPLGNLSVQQELEKRYGLDQTKKSEWAAYWSEVGFEALEEFLKPHAGKYSFGDTLTAADCFVVPQVFTAKRFNTNLDRFPLIQKINANCLELAAFQKAAPDKQPDTPANA